MKRILAPHLVITACMLSLVVIMVLLTGSWGSAMIAAAIGFLMAEGVVVYGTYRDLAVLVKRQ